MSPWASCKKQGTLDTPAVRSGLRTVQGWRQPPASAMPQSPNKIKGGGENPGDGHGWEETVTLIWTARTMQFGWIRPNILDAAKNRLMQAFGILEHAVACQYPAEL